MAEIDARLVARRLREIREATGTDDPKVLKAMLAPPPELGQPIGVDGLHKLVRDLLEGPWSGTEPMARTAACIVEGHPRIHGDLARDCYCRMVKADG